MAQKNKHIRISLDAMGGDFSPKNEIIGGLNALRETNNRFEIVFIGPKDSIEQCISGFDTNGLLYSIQDASEVISMQDSPVAALREKKNSSIAVGLQMHKDDVVDAFVSVGNTGAVVSASNLILGRLENVSRPTIGAILPTQSGVTLLLDAGAVTDSKPHYLYEFALMGSVYARLMFKKEHPTVGLLNIGEESAKGNEVTKAAYKLLEKGILNFKGNVEGKDILDGKVDVVVCDGFVGNTILKFGESFLGVLKSKIQEYAGKNIFRKLWVGMMRKTLRSILKDFDYQEYGGVPLLGVNGVTIIGHGRSTPRAITNMIIKAEEMVRLGMNGKLRKTLNQLKTVPETSVPTS